MTIQAIDSLYKQEPDLYAQERPDQLGKEDFLKILVTQLQYQDPLDPQDPAEFTSQLTEMSSLEQLMGLNEEISTLQMLQMSNNNTQAIGLIGNDVLYEGDTFTHTSGQTSTLDFMLEEDAENVNVTIHNSEGSVIKAFTVNDVESGMQSIEWDGLDSNGNVIASGDFCFEITATDAAGNSMEVMHLTDGRVSAVSFEDGVTYLKIGELKIPVNQVVSVMKAEEDSDSANAGYYRY
ncbi:MAG: flagellar hook assembly protein FlgD [Candidatus Sumerlaeia bacterium]